MRKVMRLSADRLAFASASLAASKLGVESGETAVKFRNEAAKQMTPAQVLVAQEMAKRCEESDYKKCDKIEANQSGSSEENEERSASFEA
jgi:hypothetical protein